MTVDAALKRFEWAVALAAPPLLVALGAIACGGACGGSTPPAGPPPAGPGVGYDDLRVLTRDQCSALRDHQIDIAIESALADAGPDDTGGARLVLEARLRSDSKALTESWIKRCTGRALRARDYRCMKESTTPHTFQACGEESDAGTTTG